MEDLESRDQSCRVSGIVVFCEQAHLVPAGERERWDTNMGESSDLEIQLALNGMLLGVDLHRSFDAGTWVPMVKEGGRLIVYVVRTADCVRGADGCVEPVRRAVAQRQNAEAVRH